MRFRKSIKIAPGLRMNLSGSGVSWTLGPRGASVGIGKRGSYFNTGIPGTGLSTRTQLTGGSRATNTSTFSISISVGDDGSIAFKDGQGNPLSDKLVAAAKRQNGEAIHAMIQSKCDEINGEIEAVGALHLNTPSPVDKPTYIPREFDEYPPKQPVPQRPSFIQALFKRARERIETNNRASQARYEEVLKSWNARKLQFDTDEADRRRFLEDSIYHDADAMWTHLQHTLQDIVWPRETLVSMDILEGGRVVFIDVDLPEIEDMPNKTAVVPSKGYKLSVKTMSTTNVQKLYLRHIHAIAFRIVGEVFRALPNTQVVVLSGYSQRPDPTTGHIHDDYLLSVRVSRPEWEKINFDHLNLLEVTESLAHFQIRRDLTKSGLFKTIEPFSPEAEAEPS